MAEQEIKTQFDMAVQDFDRMNLFMTGASSLMMRVRSKRELVADTTIILQACDAINEVYRIPRAKLAWHSKIASYKLKLVELDGKMRVLWEHARAIVTRNENLMAEGNFNLNTLYRDNDGKVLDVFDELNDVYNAVMMLRSMLGYDAKVEIKKDVASELNEMEDLQWEEQKQESI
jgi:hypothetical protein